MSQRRVLPLRSPEYHYSGRPPAEDGFPPVSAALVASPTPDRVRSGRPGTSDYAALLKQVQSGGLMQRRRGYYAVRGALLLAALAGVWVGFAVIGDHWAQIAIAAALGIVVTQLLFLSHDAAHKQIFTSGRANDWVALLVGTGLCGVSLAWWKDKHTRHHANPNQISKDPDISPSVVHFYPAEQPPRSAFARGMYQRQGWWFYPLLVVEALNLQAQSLVALVTKPSMKRRRLELALLILRIAAVPVLAFVFLSPGVAGVFVAVQLAVTGVYLGATFAVSHVGMPVVPADARIDFLRRQISSSRNIKGGRAASFAMGGLNYQIEHHLFPSVARPNLVKVRALVRAFCAQHDLEYQEIYVHHAWAIVIRYLNQVGVAGRNDVACPTAAILR